MRRTGFYQFNNKQKWEGRHYSEGNMPQCNVFFIIISDSFPNLSGNTLTPDDLGQVLEAVMDVAAQWYPLGLQLKVKTGTLDSIRTQFQNPRDQLLEMLKTWLTTSDSPSWRTLIDALRSRSVGASQLASELEKKCLVKKAEVGKGMSASDSLAGKSLAMRDRYLHVPQSCGRL